MLTVKKKWEEFERATLPPDASPLQRAEMRKAFYGGVFVLLNMMADVSEDASEDEGCVVLESVNRECQEFFRALLS